MSKHTDTSRRSFFLKGGAALGAGLASAGAGAASLLDGSGPLRQQVAELHTRLATLEDREALRQLPLAFASLLERQAYPMLETLFTGEAELDIPGGRVRGRQAIGRLFAESYAAQRADSMLKTLIPEAAGQPAEILMAEDRLHASACVDVRAEVCRPLRGDSVLVEMARLQGHGTAGEWRSARLEFRFAKERGHWLISGLDYRSA